MQTVSRLIDQFVPEHYQLSLTLQRVERVFSGLVVIKGTTITDEKTILVHTKDLTIESITVDGKAASFTPGENDELIISHPDITRAKHIVTIAFNGTITNGMHGLYPCFYEHDGAKKELLATQFESHHAREAFPCIDEPEAKATFDLTVTTEQNVTVLGNMPVKHQGVEDDLLVTSFETSPRMSTYLLAWVVGELHKKTAKTKSGVEVNVYATPAQSAASLDFSLDIATRTIDFFETYFDTPYPLPKSDHVALPDFSAGAMENWGLVTYREIALLADPETTSISTKHYVATVVAHELSHQWFGNLVTMKWWNNLWLNESFATLMEYIAIDALQPEWNIWFDFSTAETISALRRDSIDGVQAVQVEVHHPDEINTLFDPSIVYAKGARLLRMLQRYIGDADFQSGLKAYFATYAYQNTDGDDLWKALSQASGKDIASFMNTWISQSGYPRVSVSQNKDEITLTQQQFFVGPHSPSTKLWPIPLNASSKDIPFLFDTPEAKIVTKDSTPLRLNVGDSAHFVTQYDAVLLARIIEQLKEGTLQPIDRLQLLDEQTLLARGGEISSATLIPLLEAYKNEATEAVWDIVSMTLGELRKFIEQDASAEAKLRELSAALARPQYERLGWIVQPNEVETDTKLRSMIASAMIYGEDKEAIASALKIYTTTPLEKIEPELRSLIISTAVRYSDDESIVDTLLATYKASQSPDLQQDIAAGLTATRDETVIKRLLDCIKDGTVRAQDAGHWFVWLIRNRYGRVIAWQWLRDNWQWIETTFKSDKSYDDYPRFVGSSLMSQVQLDEYKAFFTPMQDTPSLKRVITMGISEIEGRIALLERDQEAVCSTLRQL